MTISYSSSTVYFCLLDWSFGPLPSPSYRNDRDWFCIFFLGLLYNFVSNSLIFALLVTTNPLLDNSNRAFNMTFLYTPVPSHVRLWAFRLLSFRVSEITTWMLGYGFVVERAPVKLRYTNTSALALLSALPVALVLERGAECSSPLHKWDTHSTSIPLLHKESKSVSTRSQAGHMKHPSLQHIPYDIVGRQSNKAPLSTQMGYKSIQNR